MSSEILPPAQPAYILRGHSAQVHALHFTLDNQRLVTGDADGWLVSWNLAFKRPVASWRAHQKGILGIGSWGRDCIISYCYPLSNEQDDQQTDTARDSRHGRDNKLIVWRLGPEDEGNLENTLPIDAKAVASSKQPWILHILTVNTLNFCSFAMCNDGMPQLNSNGLTLLDKGTRKPILVAVPNTIDSGGIDLYQFPSESRAAVIHADRNITTGMVMALAILAETTRIQVAAGYESGHTMVFVQTDPGASFTRLYCANPHRQPVLSLALSHSRDYYLTSSADAIIAKHPFPFVKGVWKTELKPLKICQTKHAGQQGLQIRSDNRIFSTAGWDARIRVYSAKTMKELAVLSWHKTGCYATAFAQTGLVGSAPAPQIEQTEPESVSDPTPSAEREHGAELALTKQQSSVVTSIQQRREEKAQTTHWLAAGSKDGKVSLWNIY